MSRIALIYLLIGIVLLLLFVSGLNHGLVAVLTCGFIIASLQIFIIGAVLHSTYKYVESRKQ
ncbi:MULTISPECIES: hypothetical protein [Bacillaceae]|uniref:hypothetical protein n=1 Tax=Bacillaceae TaxID=186817 RepID=UPI000AE758C3|nr:hypothetical protein [Bacillus rubiinfantis]